MIGNELFIRLRGHLCLPCECFYLLHDPLFQSHSEFFSHSIAGVTSTLFDLISDKWVEVRFQIHEVFYLSLKTLPKYTPD